MSNLPSTDLRFAEYISTLVVVEDNIVSTLLVMTCFGFLLIASISFADAYELPALVSRRACALTPSISTNTVG